MDILYVIALSLGSILEIFILCKIMGYRQISQMSMFDYINGITIGNIASEMATSIEDDFIHPMIAMIVYGIVAVLLSWISSKSIRARRFLSGKPILLVHQGTLYEQNFKKSKVDLNEFLTQCRVNGYFDLDELESVILEENGRMSFLPKSENRPLTAGDLQLSPAQENLVANLIIDGKVMEENLRHTGKNIQWLDKELHRQGIKNIQDVFLATYDLKRKVSVYTRTSEQTPPDLFS